MRLSWEFWGLGFVGSKSASCIARQDSSELYVKSKSFVLARMSARFCEGVGGGGTQKQIGVTACIWSSSLLI